MLPFPYFEILKKAYRFTINQLWLWVFGFFIGGIGGINFGSLDFATSPPRNPQLRSIGEFALKATNWISANLGLFALFAILALAAVLILVIFSGISKGAVIWSAQKLTEKELPTFRKSLKIGQRYVWQIIVLQFIVTLAYLVALLVFALPISYLFFVGAVSRAVILFLIGLVIFLPATVVFSFMHLYGPIFVVSYGQSVPGAIQLSFSLVRQKLKESLILAIYLIGSAILFIFALGFSIILAGVPLALLGWLMVALGFILAAKILAAGFIVLVVVYIMIMGSGFAVFQNIAWVLAVREMIKTRKLPEEEKKPVPAAEPAV